MAIYVLQLQYKSAQPSACFCIYKYEMTVLQTGILCQVLYQELFSQRKARLKTQYPVPKSCQCEWRECLFKYRRCTYPDVQYGGDKDSNVHVCVCVCIQYEYGHVSHMVS